MTRVTAAIVYASYHHGNTQRVAAEIARALAADLVTADTADPDGLSTYDLIGFGSGIYFGRPHRSLRQLVQAMPNGTKDVFLFSTSGLPFLAPVWHRGLRRELEEKHYSVVGEFGCRGWDTVGPLWVIGGLNLGHPDQRDLERAADFVRSL